MNKSLLSIALSIVSANAFATAAPDAPVSSTYHCFVPQYSVTQPTHTLSLWGSTTFAHVGFSKNNGGIATSLILGDSTNTHVQVLESRSGAGAAWQFSNGGYLGTNNRTDFDHTTLNPLINQGGGNARGYQWSIGVDLRSTATSVNQADWAQAYTDTVARYAPDLYPGQDKAVTVGTSPCEPYHEVTNPLLMFDLNSMDAYASTVQTSAGTATRLDWHFSQKSLFHHVIGTWDEFGTGHGFYLNRATARAYNLKMYLVRPDLTAPDAVIEVSPQDDFRLSAQDEWIVDIWAGPTHMINRDRFSHVAFIWTLPTGKKVGFAAPYKHGGVFRLEKTIYCTNPDDDQCGSISVGVGFPTYAAGSSTPMPFTYVSFPTDQIRRTSAVFWFGDFDQLTDIIVRDR